MSDGSTGGAGGLFVVGTDTGVGKTVVTAGLTGWLRERGRDAIAIKPCQTGYPPDDDAGFVAEACGSEEAATCLRRLEPPLAPAVAADRTDTDLSYDEIRDGVEAAVDAHETAVVEGIGGLRVPLADDREVLDLVADIGLPAVVVARSGLGTLNHTGLTVDALRDRGVSVRGIVFNEYEGATTAERTNPEVLEGMTDCPVWPLPPLSLSDPSVAVSGVREHVPATVFDAL
ncbi:dethiobiotin synthase [Haloarcula amylovorans]|uniref:dethiobiotin synthase n=1 Tax=Haloarcula amylovorans TaxID=2562280 RepID=UPI001FD84F08|nr:dethiobiotin synthase [Halomicroarcula amylolytica]